MDLHTFLLRASRGVAVVSVHASLTGGVCAVVLSAPIHTALVGEVTLR
jgi:hypothetical protein